MNAKESGDHHTEINTGGGAYIEGNVYTGGGDFVGRDKITIYQSPMLPPLNYRSDITDIVTYYTEIFVGRKREWVEITRFAGQAEPGYMLIVASAGYGKTALVAHLIQCYETNRWENSPLPNLIYFFIRQEGQRHTPVAFLQSLNSQLLNLLNHPGGVSTDLIALRSQFNQLWSQALATAGPSHPLLLLLDGLDEQAPSEVTIAQLLPANLGPYVHVIITSRPNPEPLEQVSLTHPFQKASELYLQTFTENEIQILLQEYEMTADTATSLALRVHTITKGEPLLTRFVCQEVAKESEIALARLEQHPPSGVEGYFHRQFKQLDSIVEGELAWQILVLLTVTLGGITVEEIAEVLEVGKRQVRKAIEPIQRFLLGQERLELMHLQMRKAIIEEFSEGEQIVYQKKLLTWCNSYQGKGWPESTPHYILFHYAKHLAEARQSEALYALISKRWMDIKFQHAFSHRMFAEDVSLMLDVAKEDNLPNLIQTIRGCLIYVNLKQLASNVSPEILEVLTQLGYVEQAFDYASLMEDVVKRSKTYVLICRVLIEQGEVTRAEKALQQALVAVKRVLHLSYRVSTLQEIAQVLVHMQLGERINQYIDEVMAAAKIIGNDEDRESISVTVIQTLTQVGMFDQALTLIEAIQSKVHKAPSLCCLALTLANVGNQKKAIKLCNQALIEAEAIEAGIRRYSALVHVVETLIKIGEPKKNKFPKEPGIFQKFSYFLRDFRFRNCLDAFNLAMTLAKRFEEEIDNAEALGQLALVLAQGGETEYAEQIFNRALSITEANRYTFFRTSSFLSIAIALARVGDKEKAKKIFHRVQAEIEIIEDQGVKTNLVRWVVLALANTGMISEALSIVKRIESKSDRTTALTEMVKVMVEKEVHLNKIQIATVVAAIEAERVTGKAIGLIAQILVKAGEKLTATKLVTQALSPAETIKNGHLYTKTIRVDAFRKFAWAFAITGIRGKTIHLMNQVLAMAESSPEWHKISILSLAVPTLTEAGDRAGAVKILKLALTLAHVSSKDKISLELHILCSLVPYLTSSQVRGRNRALETLEWALRKAEKLQGNWARVKALCEIALAFTKIGNRNRAREIFNYAMEIALAPPEVTDKSKATGTSKHGIRVEIKSKDEVEKSSIKWDKARLMNKLANALAEAMMIEDALVVTEMIEVKRFKAYTLGQIAQIMVQKEYNSAAVQMATKVVTDSYSGDEIFSRQDLTSIFFQMMADAGLVDHELVIEEALELGFRIPAWSAFAQALIYAKQPNESKQNLHNLFVNAAQTGYPTFFLALKHSAMTIASLDQGETLWKVYNAIREVESWWETQTT